MRKDIAHSGPDLSKDDQSSRDEIKGDVDASTQTSLLAAGPPVNPCVGLLLGCDKVGFCNEEELVPGL